MTVIASVMVVQRLVVVGIEMQTGTVIVHQGSKAIAVVILNVGMAGYFLGTFAVPVMA